MFTNKAKSADSKPEKPSKPTRPWPDTLMRVLPVLVFGMVCLTAFLMYISPAAAVSTCMLYSIANNQKMSGRADGNVYMRNGRIRGMRIPALVRNGYTTYIRGILSTLSSGFRALTATQRAQWNAYTVKAKSNRFAQPYAVSGKAAYVSVNTNLQLAGHAVINAPLALAGALDETVDTLAAANGANTMSYNATNLSAASTYLVFATNGLSAGVARPGASKFRLLGIQPVPVLGVVNIAALYIAKYGHVPAAGDKVFLYTVPVNSTTGEGGAGSAVLSAVVAA